MPNSRQKFQTRSIILATDSQRHLAQAAIGNAPFGIEVVLREPVKARKLDQQALYWVNPLADISSQAWVNGCQYSAEVWHEQFKREYLPEVGCEEFERHVKNPEKYVKWANTARGDRVCVGSTTDLTVWGFSQYLEQVYAFGSSLGVLFSARPQ